LQHDEFLNDPEGDVQTAEWILPAVDQCKTDIDPKVVALAEELACYVREKTTPPPP